MRNFRNFITGFVAVLIIGGIVLAQTSQYGTRQSVFNANGGTVKANKVLKWDSSFAWLMTLDTTYYVHAADTTGKGSDRGGSTGLVGKFTDNITKKKGGQFELNFQPFTAASTDSIIIYGWKSAGIYSRGDSISIRDTVILATTGTRSKYLWAKLDTILIRCANAGTDCVKIFYHQPLKAKIADSLTTVIAGVMMDSTYTLRTDTIPDSTYGQVISSGDVRVYANGKTTPIKAGDQLMVGTNGKVVKAIYPKSDTIRTAAAFNVRYLKDVRPWDIFQLTRIERNVVGLRLKDSTVWSAKGVVDSMRITVGGVGTANLPASAYSDSLMYSWTPRGIIGLGENYIIGTALEPCTLDSTLIYVRLKQR